MLLTFLLVLVLARLGDGLARCLGQPSVIGEVALGVLLGPSVVGSVWPGLPHLLFGDGALTSLQALAQVGLVLFVFTTSAAIDLKELHRSGRRAVFISNASVIVPATLGFVLAMWMHPRLAQDVDRIAFCLFVVAAMAVTALPVLARILQETGLSDSQLGVLAIACAVVDDLTAWCLLAVVSAIVGASDFTAVATTVVLMVVFVGTCFVVVRPVLRRLPYVPTWAAVVLALSCASFTDAIGLHAVFGAFIGGLIVPRSRLHQNDIERVLLPLLLPVFFVTVGLSTRFGALWSPYLWGITLLVMATAVVSKLAGCVVASRLSGQCWRDSAALGVLLNARGLTELVVLSVGRELKLINSVVFSMFVLMALATTFVTTPALHRLVRGLSLGSYRVN